MGHTSKWQICMQFQQWRQAWGAEQAQAAAESRERERVFSLRSYANPSLPATMQRWWLVKLKILVNVKCHLLECDSFCRGDVETDSADFVGFSDFADSTNFADLADIYWWKLSIDESCLLIKVVHCLLIKVFYCWKLSIKVKIVKEVIACDLSSVVMFR